MTHLFCRRGLMIFVAAVSLFGIGMQRTVRAGKSEPEENVTIIVNVSASAPGGNPLTYRWRSTDGRIIDQDAPSTEWTLSTGPGIHFAYVLISNGKGGYTERRIAVNTDMLMGLRPIHPPMDLIPPSAPASSSVPFRDWLGGGMTSYELGGVKKQFKVALPDVQVRAFLSDPTVSEITSTNLMGDFTLQHFPPHSVPGILCILQGFDIFFGCASALQIDIEANQTNTLDPVPTINPHITWITGSVLLEDGSACGTENEFFGVTSTATAELVDVNGVTIPGSRVRANSWGQFSIALTQPVHTSVVVRCEGAAPVRPTTVGFDVGIVRIIGVRAPEVMDMSVTSPILTGTFEQPKTGLPSDVLPLRPPTFLAMKGLDTRRSACQYYKAIGAVRDCDAEGNFQGGAVSFEDWKRAVKIDQYALPGTQQYRALFVNKVDLNLTRDHHSVSYGPNATAGYVCNHNPPETDTEHDTDIAIENAADGRNLVACVAMDYSAAPGVNDNTPFTRFLIFGPTGELLPSVNLDKRGEKFVPGTCVVCHGGNKYAGKFPEDGTGTADIAAHFLPFDIASLAFHSSKPGLTKADQQEPIFHLNQNVLSTNVNTAESELIHGWYEQQPQTFVQDELFVPLDIMVHPDQRKVYENVIAKSCRTCHIAQRDERSIRDLTFSRSSSFSFVGLSNTMVCGERDELVRAYTMPNSEVTFNRFWLSDQPTQLAAYLKQFKDDSTCTNPKAP
jgi:hypothetical protein